MILESRANDLPFIVKILRTDESDHAVHQERIESAGNAVGARLQSQLIDSEVRPRRQRASLPGFKIHNIVALPTRVSLPILSKNLFSTFTQHRHCNSQPSL